MLISHATEQAICTPGHVKPECDAFSNAETDLF